MVNSIFGKSSKAMSRSKMQSTTLRGFGGGWNTIDDDLSMAPRYVVSLKNFYRTSSGGQALRFGTNWFCDIKDVCNSPIVDQTYFNNRLINVCANGWIVTASDGGTKTVIWSPALAALLPGSPGGWSSGLTLITFVPFKDKLVVHNGVDKPLEINSLFAVTYLQDAATGSNVNVPIGKYACTASNYHCVAGISGSPTEIVISSSGTSGTFPLDPDPNDAISIDVGAYAPEGAASIRGIAGYRSYLIVFLQGISLQVQLGVYDTDGNHTPKFPDAFPTFGLVGSRCITKIENDLIFSGLRGLASASRSVAVAGQIDSTTVSSVIEPEYQKTLGNLTDSQKQLGTFTIYDQLSHNLMLFIPGGRVLVYTSNAKLNYKGWSEFDGMDWTCGCASLLGRVFLCKGTRIYQYGNNTFGERFYADKLEDRDGNWANNTAYTVGQLLYDSATDEVWTCAIAHTSPLSGTFLDSRTLLPNRWTLYEGIAIDFEMELPWFDGKDPMITKKMRFVSIGTKGTAEFTLAMYVDNFYKDFDGNIIYDPAISMTFIGNDAPGYGVDGPIDPYGGGRRSKDPRLTGYPAKFKMAKFKFSGSTVKPLELINLSFLFARGTYFRG